MVEVILALDLPRASEALRLLDGLTGLRWVKVGSIPHDAEKVPRPGTNAG